MFTTRPDTLFGATFMVLAPEHPLVEIADRTGADAPRSRRTWRLRADKHRDRPAVARTARRPACAIGADAINPVNGERIPIWIADYVLERLRHGRHHGRPRPR